MTTQVNIKLPFTKKLRSKPYAIEVEPADVFGKVGQSLVVYDEEGLWLGEVLWMPWCGDGLMAVRPDRRREGIGTRLLAVAVELWPEADLMRQKPYSEDGIRLVESFLKHHQGQRRLRGDVSR
jgi:GNAT superfamily N-acetyltransferase